ncbi:APC family permease [Telmatobacter sp. DSM 110680]|uniref:APC family permease n=1 Tax=Telmatobacter sp. DSM 110680 TaxID=3036704 RepID=A0AAU7DN96_9BACT
MGNQSNAEAKVYSEGSPKENYGLHAGVLGPLETLAQSVSAMAPSTSPSLTIPLVFAIAGNATWLVYLLATGATLIVGFCVSRFARLSASPGSLYTYTAETLPTIFGVAAGWGLLLAYLATAASVAGGALYYTNVLSQQFLHRTPPVLLTLVVICLAAGFVAYRDVKLSAELMLWIEICSVSLICIVLTVMPVHFGFHLDMDQFRLRGVSFSSLGPALVLSMFSFVGFESATTLGSEARNPLRTIPRAVIQCAILAGIFFMLCSYSEVLGFRGESGKLSDTTSPLHILADKAGVSPLGTGIDFGALISMVACVLACITAASRVLMRMARERLLPVLFEKTSERHTCGGHCVVHVRCFPSYSCNGDARSQRIRRVRPARLSIGLRLSDSVCARCTGVAVCATCTRSAFTLRRSSQCHRGSGSDSDRRLRSTLHRRHCPRAASLHLPALHRDWPRLVRTEAQADGSRLNALGLRIVVGLQNQ